MESLSRVVSVLIMTIFMVINCTGCVSATEHKVGGRDGWKPGVNYTEWASTEHFYIGDWISFRYPDQRRYYNVLEVNRTDYESCSSDHPIKNVSRGGGRDYFQLTEPKTYYFLSGGGFCYNGMKVAVDVEDPPPNPAPAPNMAPPSGLGFLMVLLMLLQTVLAWVFGHG